MTKYVLQQINTCYSKKTKEDEILELFKKDKGKPYKFTIDHLDLERKGTK